MVIAQKGNMINFNIKHPKKIKMSLEPKNEVLDRVDYKNCGQDFPPVFIHKVLELILPKIRK